MANYPKLSDVSQLFNIELNARSIRIKRNYSAAMWSGDISSNLELLAVLA